MSYTFDLKVPVNQNHNAVCPRCQGELVLTIWEQEPELKFQKLRKQIMGLTLEAHKETMLAQLREIELMDKPEQRAMALDRLLRTFQRLRDDEINSGAAMPALIVWKEREKGLKIAETGYDTSGMPEEKGE